MKRPLNLLVCLLVPALVLVAGLALAGTYRYRAMPELMKDIAKGMAPPGFSVKLPKAGTYTIWLNTHALFDGDAFDYEDQLQEGGRIFIFDQATGKALDVQTLVLSKRAFGRDTAVSLGNFETLKPNQTIEVKASGLRRPALIGIAPNRLADSMDILLHLLGILCLTCFLAFLILAVLLHRRKRQLEAEPV